MLREAGLLVGKAGKGGVLGTVHQPLLSLKVQQLVSEEDPALLTGFLTAPANRAVAALKGNRRGAKR
jgi:hypothetical protein